MMFATHHDGEDYPRYPDPPLSASSYESATTSPMEMNGIYSIPTSVAFEPSLYAETSHYLMSHGHGHTSPSLYPDDNDLRIPSSSLSAASAASSAAASPQSNPGHHSLPSPQWAPTGLMQPTIVSSEYIAHHPDFSGYHPQHMEEMAFDFAPAGKAFVDPSLINQEMGGLPVPAPHYDYHFHHHQQPQQHFPTSPSVASSPQLKMLRTNSSSPTYFSNPQMHPGPFGPAPFIDHSTRRPSMGGFISPSGEYHSGDESRIKQRCTYPECGKVFKDLKAHMLTHQNERPEKCPIQTCEYHTKGFARKYDKNRHTLTHYKGTMVCGFCPGSGSASEKSFNRADVFKRHLTAVHGVEQSPPNGRKKGSMTMTTTKKLTTFAAGATGKCSTCSKNFPSPQDFYEHLDDCVLRMVQKEDPSEAINAQCLGEVENDKDVQETLEKNNLPLTTQATPDAGDDSDMAEDDDDDASSVKVSSGVSKKKGNPANGVQKSRGMTHSRGGVPMAMKSKNRKNRDKRYPPSWGYDPVNMNLKHRVMACFDGPRRLAKDDMALSTSHEVRIKLSDPKAYTTDLDIQTLKRAEGFHSATEEEKGIWISDDPTEAQFRQMSEVQAMLGPQ